MKDFKGKTAFVTGAGSGIGLGLALALASEGAKVAIAGTNMERLEAAAVQVRARGAEVFPVRLDVAIAEDWKPALDAAEAALGPVRLLCLNAGISTGMSTVEETPIDLWQSIIDVNLNGVFYAIRAWLPTAKQRGAEAHILITGSMTGILPMGRTNAYSVSKAAVWCLADVLRMELAGSPIGISMMHPGVTRTSLLETTQRHAPPSRDSSMDEKVASVTSSGYDPEKVAAFTLNRLRQGDVHICTHPALKPGVAARFDDFLSGMRESADPEHDSRHAGVVRGVREMVK